VNRSRFQFATVENASAAPVRRSVLRCFTRLAKWPRLANIKLLCVWATAERSWSSASAPLVGRPCIGSQIFGRTSSLSPWGVLRPPRRSGRRKASTKRRSTPGFPCVCRIQEKHERRRSPPEVSRAALLIPCTHVRFQSGVNCGPRTWTKQTRSTPSFAVRGSFCSTTQPARSIRRPRTLCRQRSPRVKIVRWFRSHIVCRPCAMRTGSSC